MLEVRKFSLFFLVSKLGKFLLFDNFFLNLADFWDLNNFLVFDNFPHFSINLLPSSTPQISSAASTSLATNTCNDTVVFNINVNSVAILLKP